MVVVTGEIYFLLSFWLGFWQEFGILSILSCCRSLFCLFFFFPLVSGHFNLDNWVPESQSCLELFLQRTPQDISWGHLSLTESQPLWIEVPVNTKDKVLVTESVHKVAAVLSPTFSSRDKQSLQHMPNWRRIHLEDLALYIVNVYIFIPFTSHFWCR